MCQRVLWRCIRAASVWGDFVNIIEEAVTGVGVIKSNEATVFADQSDIVVKGARVGETISVYTIEWGVW